MVQGPRKQHEMSGSRPVLGSLVEERGVRRVAERCGARGHVRKADAAVRATEASGRCEVSGEA